MPNSNQYTETRAEFMALYEQIRHDYEDAKGVVHGVMKDAIQNGFGHRTNIKYANEWGMEIELIENKDRKLVTITDHGTSGLIGSFYDNIDDVSAEVRNDPEEKLARCERVLHRGANVAGAAGSQGRGLLVYQFNSDEDKIMWDSLRSSDVKYVANHRKLGEDGNIIQLKKPLKDNEAHQFINDQARLEPLDRPGTRFTIFSPSEEFVAVIKDGTFAKYIGNTWFEMLGILGESMDGIYIIVNGERTKVELPEHWKKYFNDEYEESHVYKMDGVNVRFNYRDPDTGTQYNPVSARASKIVYALADEDLDEDQRGIVVNRSFMAINQANPIIDPDLPPDAKKRVFGYVKLESSPVAQTGKSYEEMIKITEDPSHYRFGNKNVFLNLKTKVMEGNETFKRRAGIVSRSATHTARRTRLAANRASQDINEYLGTLGIGGGGQRDHRSDFIVSLEKINFPGQTSMVLIGQSVTEIAFRLKNKTPNNQTVKLVVDVLDKDRHDTIEVISDGEKILINSYNHELSEKYSINFSENKYRTHNLNKIYIRATIKDENGEKLAYKIVPVYLGYEPDETWDKPIVVYESLNLPNDNGRVDFGDKIDAVNCLVKNETGFEWELKLKCGVFHPETEEWIETLIKSGPTTESFILGPYTDATFPAGEISFDEEKYGHINEGKLQLRSKLISATEQHDNDKGGGLSLRNQTLWLNKDPDGRGLFKVDTNEGSPSDRRCKVEGSNGSRMLIVNINHPAFTALDEELKVEVYVAHLCLFEGMKYSWQNNYEGPFGIAPSDDIPFDEAIEHIIIAYDKGLENYHGS